MYETLQDLLKKKQLKRPVKLGTSRQFLRAPHRQSCLNLKLPYFWERMVDVGSCSRNIHNESPKPTRVQTSNTLHLVHSQIKQVKRYLEVVALS